MNLQRKRKKERRMGNPHVLVMPYPAQGHIIPLLELSQCLVQHGFKITYRVLSQPNHEWKCNEGQNRESNPSGFHS
jgi:hypothetical protein